MNDPCDIPGHFNPKSRRSVPISPQMQAARLLLLSLPQDQLSLLLKEMAPHPTPDDSAVKDRWVTPTEAASLMRLNTRTLRRYVLAGRLPCRKTFGRSVRYRLSDLEKIFRPIGEV